MNFLVEGGVDHQKHLSLVIKSSGQLSVLAECWTSGLKGAILWFVFHLLRTYGGLGVCRALGWVRRQCEDPALKAAGGGEELTRTFA